MRKNANNENNVSPKEVSNVCRIPSELLSSKRGGSLLGVPEQDIGRYAVPVVTIDRLAKYRKTDLDAFILLRVQGG